MAKDQDDKQADNYSHKVILENRGNNLPDGTMRNYEWIEMEQEIPENRGYFGESSTQAFVERVTGSVLASDIQGASSVDANEQPLEREDENEEEQISRQKEKILLADSARCRLPSRQLADHLVDIYFRYFHIIYPYLHEPTFRQEYEQTWAPGGKVSFLWHSQLNIVFALASHFIDAESMGIIDEGLGVSFFRLSKSLLDARILEVGSLRMVQNLLLMGVYLQSTGRQNVCYNVIGLAVRVSQGLALHLEPPNKPKDCLKTELERRLWWACVTLDSAVSMQNGRPASIPEDCYDRHMPSEVDDCYIFEDHIEPQPHDIPSYISFFIQTIELYKSLNLVLKSVYHPTKKELGVSYYQHRWLDCAMVCAEDMYSWMRALPPHLHPSGSHAQDNRFIRQRNILKARYLNIRVLMSRPSLLAFAPTRKMSREGGESEIRPGGLLETTTLNTALICVNSAQKLLQLFGTSDKKHLGLPWSNIFYSYSAATVLLAAKCCPLVFSRCDTETLERSWQQGIAILESYKNTNIGSERCLRTLKFLLERLPAGYFFEHIEQPQRSLQFDPMFDYGSSLDLTVLQPLSAST